MLAYRWICQKNHQCSDMPIHHRFLAGPLFRSCTVTALFPLLSHRCTYKCPSNKPSGHANLYIEISIHHGKGCQPCTAPLHYMYIFLSNQPEIV